MSFLSKQGVAEGGEIVCGHQGRIGNGDIRARGHPMARQELCDLSSQRRIEGLVGGIAIVELAPYRYRTIDAQRRKDELLEVWPFIFAIALGYLPGEVLRLGKLIVTPDTAGGRLKVHLAALQATPRGRPDRTGREEPHRA